jgi:CubicO group peptidase (beta-lactamase class C family)
MQDYKIEDGWYYGQHFSKHPAYHMRLSARDLARLGLLYLNDGAWNGTPILPQSWVRVSTRRHSDAAFGLGYGYMWWIGRRKPFRLPFEEASYSARGYRGQRVHVIPGLRLVIVHQYAGRGDNDTGISDQKLGDLVDVIVAAHPDRRR